MIRYADNTLVSNPGSPIHQLYAPKVAKNGRIELVKSGTENIQDFINSFRESTDIHQIMNRVMNGQIELLNKRPGSYGDFTQMPKTFAEALQLQIDSRRLFDNLPDDVKAKFHGDANMFLAAAGTEEWFKNIEKVLPAEVKNMIMPPKVEHVVESEVKE